jgi:uncharacterized membrane protein
MKRRLSQAAALASYLGLIGLLTVWNVWLAPSAALPISLVLVVAVFPLLLPLRGVLHGRVRTHLWAAYLILLYFIHGVGVAYADPAERWLGLLEIALSLTFFFSASFYARWSASGPTQGADP